MDILKMFYKHLRDVIINIYKYLFYYKENEVKCEKFLKSMEFHNEETDQ